MLKKAVIPAAGFGTRMLPVAKAIPKEMLPILDRPTIQYVIEELAEADFSDVLMVTSRDKKAIEDHFDRAPELEQRLAASKREHLLASIHRLSKQLRVHSIRQPEQRGLGDAVHQARHHVGNAPFLCALGDTLFSGPVLPAAQLRQAHQKLGTSVIGLECVSPESVERYGVIAGREIEPGVWRIDDLVEKPPRDRAPSNLAIAARYVLTPGIFDCLDETTPGKGNEIQLTDALKLLLYREPIHGIVLDARRHDIGNPIDWLKTNLLYASRDPALWAKIKPFVDALG